ncbi:Prostaglandin E synthase 3 (Cytosolic) [Arthrobotrys conoides]|uniref:Prostaglandin E synthase 3 (Cytosolic) n=1 Tax=Arthrobotrys conoides TaxID=74498 RepID=A0AAN8NI43_9PEZI
MASSSTTFFPEVLWAQRSSPSVAEKNTLYVTILQSDVSKENLKLDLTPTSLTYKGVTNKGKEYSFKVDFFEEIDVENSRHIHTDRATECIIRKKALKEEFWPRLTKEKVKLHWLKTDFDKWVDEDEQDGPAPEPDYDPNMMSQFGGGEDAGGFGGIDFSKLGGASDLSGLGGMGGMGMPGMPGMDMSGGGAGLEDDSDDEDMPDLEGEGDEKTKAVPSEPVVVGEKKKSPIEELD